MVFEATKPVTVKSVFQHLSVKLDITDQGPGRFTICKHVTHWIY